MVGGIKFCCVIFVTAQRYLNPCPYRLPLKTLSQFAVSAVVITAYFPYDSTTQVSIGRRATVFSGKTCLAYTSQGRLCPLHLLTFCFNCLFNLNPIALRIGRFNALGIKKARLMIDCSGHHSLAYRSVTVAHLKYINGGMLWLHQYTASFCVPSILPLRARYSSLPMDPNLSIRI